MPSPTQKVSVRTPAILRILRQDRTRRPARLTAIEKGRKSCEAGIEKVTEAEEGAPLGVYRGPDPHRGGQTLEEHAATAHHVPLARRGAMVLAEGQSRILRRHPHLDDDHGLFPPLRHGKMALSTVGARAIHDHDLHQDFQKLQAEIAVYRARSHLHRAADSVVGVIRDRHRAGEQDGTLRLTAPVPDRHLGGER